MRTLTDAEYAILAVDTFDRADDRQVETTAGVLPASGSLGDVVTFGHVRLP
jgi:hypothetical protein